MQFKVSIYGYDDYFTIELRRRYKSSDGTLREEPTMYLTNCGLKELTVIRNELNKLLKSKGIE